MGRSRCARSRRRASRSRGGRRHGLRRGAARPSSGSRDAPMRAPFRPCRRSTTATSRLTTQGDVFIVAASKTTPALSGGPRAPSGKLTAPHSRQLAAAPLVADARRAQVVVARPGDSAECGRRAQETPERRDRAGWCALPSAKSATTDIREALELALAQSDLKSTDPARRIQASKSSATAGTLAFKADLERMAGKAGSAPSEADPTVRAAASARAHQDRNARVSDRVRGPPFLRNQPGQRAAPRGVRARHHLRPDARHQHGARRDADDRRVRDVRRSELLPEVRRRRSSTGTRSSPFRRRSSFASESACCSSAP